MKKEIMIELIWGYWWTCKQTKAFKLLTLFLCKYENLKPIFK